MSYLQMHTDHVMQLCESQGSAPAEALQPPRVAGGAQKRRELSITRLHEHILQPSGQGIFKDKGRTTGNFLMYVL